MSVFIDGINIQIAINKVDNNYIFTSNYKMTNDNNKDVNITYDLDSVKEIFTLNKIPSMEIEEGSDTKTIRFDVDYDESERTFFISMKDNNTLLRKESLSVEDMFKILIDTYNNNEYITSNELIVNKISKMKNSYVHVLLKDKKIPAMKFMLQGKGFLLNSKRKEVAVFERVLINPKGNSLLLCEYIGDIPYEEPLSLLIETDIGIDYKIENAIHLKDSGRAQVLDIKYTELCCSNLIDNIEMYEGEEYDYSCVLKTIDSHSLIANTSMSNMLKDCVKYLNKTDENIMLDYIKDKKSILLKDEEENDLIQEIDDIFDDLF